MKTELYYRGRFIDSFATAAEAVHHYIDHLYVLGVNKFCDGVVLRGECGYCTIRSQFVGTRKPREFMMASRFGGILFDTMDSKKMNKAKLEKIRKDVLTIISEQFGLKFDDVKDTDTADSLGGDSLDSVECAMALEEHFGVEIEDSIIDEWQNVGECIQYFINNEHGSNPAPAAEPVRPSTVNAVKKAPAPIKHVLKGFDLPEFPTVHAHRAEIAFKQASYVSRTATSKQTAAVLDAESKAIIKVEKCLDDLKKAPAPVVRPAIPATSTMYYLVHRAGTKHTIVAGPFSYRTLAFDKIRPWLRKHSEVDPRQLVIRMGRELCGKKYTWASDYSSPRLVQYTGSKRPAPRPETPRAKAARMRAEERRRQARARAELRRKQSAAKHLIQNACQCLEGSLYTVDEKRSRIVAGPFTTMKEAVIQTIGYKNRMVFTGKLCNRERFKYDANFVPSKAGRVVSKMVAVGNKILFLGIRTEITGYDVKERMVRTEIGSRTIDQLTINYPTALLSTK